LSQLIVIRAGTPVRKLNKIFYVSLGLVSKENESNSTIYLH